MRGRYQSEHTALIRLHIWWATLQGPFAPGASDLCLCKAADVLTFLLPHQLLRLLSLPHHLAPPSVSLSFFLLSLSLSLSLSLCVPHAQPGGSALMHHGTFCSSESQCDQALRSDRTATSLSITAHRRCAVPGTVQGEDGGDGRECVWGGWWRRRRRCRVLPLTGMIRSSDSELDVWGWSSPSKRRFCVACELSKCQTRGAYGAHGARNLTNAPVTRLFYESYMWRRANIPAPVDDPTAEPPPLRDIQILFIKGVTLSKIAKRGRKETGWPWMFLALLQGFRILSYL